MTDTQRIHAYLWFFPAASIYAALAIPLSVLAMTSQRVWPPGLAGSGHAYEMLFGFALALVAGYTMGRMRRGDLLLLFAFWLAARLMLFVPFDTPTHVFNALFVITFGWHAVPRFMAAKKWRNRIMSPLLLALCALPVAYAIADYLAPTMQRQHLLLLQGVLLFALLMAFMGGRIIAPAAGGAAEREGMELTARVQPRLEAALIVLLIVAAGALFFPEGRAIAGTGAAVAGCIAAVRLYRWQLWLWQRPDLMCLGLGYGWLALGLVLYGGGILFQQHLIPALHVITIGALGTLSTGVMARLHYQSSGEQSSTEQQPVRGVPPLRTILVPAALLAVSVVLRVASETVGVDGIRLLWASAACWSCAYLYFALQFLREEILPY